jgi:hypothetical protein
MNLQDSNLKISFCIVSMNRLEHIQRTLLENIKNTIGYTNLEIVLLNYNSNDELGTYVNRYCKDYLEKGIFKYFETKTPKFFHRTHSRNLAFKLASGDVLCNIDADNFVSENFANYVNHEFKNHSNIFLSSLGMGLGSDFLGRICIRKEDFFEVGGYDERFINYGFEDIDLVNRLENYGLTCRSYDKDKIGFVAVTHDDENRIRNEAISLNLDFILINYLTHSSTEIICLLVDGTYRKNIYVDNKYHSFPQPLNELEKSQLKYGFSFLETETQSGRWQWGEEKTSIEIGHSIFVRSSLVEDCFVRANGNGEKYYKVNDENIITQTKMIFSQIPNRIIMEQNKLRRNFRVNESFGQDYVFLNFSPLRIKVC